MTSMKTVTSFLVLIIPLGAGILLALGQGQDVTGSTQTPAITKALLAGKRFKFSWRSAEGSGLNGIATLNADGSISGIGSPNESSWSVDETGRLVVRHRDGRISTRYDKVKLVPFTEQAPYQDYLPFLRKEFVSEYLTFIETYDVPFWSDFYPGDSAMTFEAAGVWFAPLICYEVTFPEYVRALILDGADFMVEITNDTWFGHSVGIHMHSRAFVTRAVENRCWGVRAANSGLSYMVDGYGRIRYDLPLDSVAALSGQLNVMDGYSVFTRVGDVAGKGSLLITVLSAGILFLRWSFKRVKSGRGSR